MDSPSEGGGGVATNSLSNALSTAWWLLVRLLFGMAVVAATQPGMPFIWHVMPLPSMGICNEKTTARFSASFP